MPWFDVLRSAISGEVITAGDIRYDVARRIWNGDIDRRPAAIAQCVTPADVAAAVLFARERGLLIAVRGGGHSFPGLSVCDDGLVIDLSRMRAVRADPDTRRLYAQGGALLGDLDRAAQDVGLVTPAGVVSHTGVAGLTLGGGYGYLSRRWGMTCDNFVAAELVTADGKVLHVDGTKEPELMWGLRGGGGNFGIVTEFEYGGYQLGPILSGWLMYPSERAGDFLRDFREFVRDMPEALCTLVRVKVPGTSTFLPPHLRSPDRWFLGVSVIWSGDHAAGESAIAPLRAWGPVHDSVRVQPYCEVQSSLDGGANHGVRRYERAGYLADIPDELIDDLVTRLDRAGDECEVSIFSLGGAIARVGEQDTAYSSRSAPLQFEARTAWNDPAERDEMVAWTRETWGVLNRHAMPGVYVNLMFDEGQSRVRALYGEEKYARLQALKDDWDPSNVFSQNQNIVPTGSTTST